MDMIKKTIINWSRENKLWAYILAGAIGFPLILAVGGLVLSLFIFLLTLLGISTGIAIAIVSLAVIGTVAGAVAYYYFED